MIGTIVSWKDVSFGRLVAILILAIVASGCTTIPSREFASYKEAFRSARSAGEEVLLDYGAAARQFDDIRAQRAAAKPKPKRRAGTFDPDVLSKEGGRLDTIAVRLKAWDVVARYNDLLTALAEGKGADDLASAVDGLSASLIGFPIAQVAATAAQVSEFLAPLRALALEAAKEQSRRQFVAAVGKGSDLISGKFIGLLRKDTVNFFQVRKGLNDLEYDPLVDQVATSADEFEEIAAKLRGSTEVRSAVAAMNAELRRIPLTQGGKPPIAPVKDPSGAAAATQRNVAALERLVDKTRDQVARVLDKNAELDAYQAVLSAYLDLLGQLEQSLRDLQLAAQESRPAIPRGDELQRAVILLRETYISYQNR